MAELRVNPESLEALKARLATPEGKEALQKLARLIAETAVDAIPPDLRESLETEEGMAAFRAAWPEIVEAFLFRGVSHRGKTPSNRKARGLQRTKGIRSS